MPRILTSLARTGGDTSFTDGFCYLGSTLSSNLGDEKDIRIQLAPKAFET